MARQIKVLVVDDSAFVRKNISLLLELDPGIKVVGTASNGKEGVTKTKVLRPDVVTMDVIMPVMNGLSAVRRIMKEAPTPIVMVSSTTGKGARETIEALNSGAVDYVTLSSGSSFTTMAQKRRELVEKIRIAFTSNVDTVATTDTVRQKFRKIVEQLSPKTGTVRAHPQMKTPAQPASLVAIASSTGGPAALQSILSPFPADFPAGIVLVQHMLSGFTSALTDSLSKRARITVKIAEEGEQIKPGTALLAPEKVHLMVNKAGGKYWIRLEADPSASSHIPSADTLFCSIAKACGPEACGVILTGMGQDGAMGLKEMRDSGSYTIAQDEKTSVIFGMPKRAIELGSVERVLPIQKIAEEILSAVGYWRSGDGSR